MIIPSGMTVNIGRKEYREGMELPANAPDSAKKLVSERITGLAKKEKGLSNVSGNSEDKNSEGGKP